MRHVQHVTVMCSNMACMTYVALIHIACSSGEIAVLQEQSQRTASIQAVNYCDLFVLTHEDLHNVFRSFPHEKYMV